MINARQTNNRRAEEWYDCDRCGVQYPRASILVQKGLKLCHGPNTNKCVDEYGYQHYYLQLEVPYERVPDELPETEWDDI